MGFWGEQQGQGHPDGEVWLTAGKESWVSSLQECKRPGQDPLVVAEVPVGPAATAVRGVLATERVAALLAIELFHQTLCLKEVPEEEVRAR